MSNIKIRNVRLEDAERLLEIYAYYVERTVITFEWEVPGVEEFRRRIQHVTEKYPYIVAELDGRVVGYCYVGPFVGRKAYEWGVETSIYLDSETRHQGVGGALYRKMEEILKAMHVLNMNACIGYTEHEDEYLNNNSAQFHAHMGYRMVGRFLNCGHKFHRWYDMVWMEKIIGEHPANPLPVANYNDIREDVLPE